MIKLHSSRYCVWDQIEHRFSSPIVWLVEDQVRWKIYSDVRDRVPVRFSNGLLWEILEDVFKGFRV